MCPPVIAAAGLTMAQAVMIGATVVSTAVSVYSQQESAKANTKAISEQNQVQADEIARATGNELHERARAARRERAMMRASASESGVNLGSGSFLAALQTSAQNQYNDMGLIVQNEKGQQRARQAQANSLMAGHRVPSALSSALTIGAAGAGSYFNVKGASTRGSNAAAGVV